MKKTIITILLIVTSVMFISPINTMALEANNAGLIVSKSNIISDTIYIATNGVCDAEEDNSLLGDPDCEDSVAWIVQLIFNIIKIAGPILVILLSSVDFIMVIIKSDNDQFQKAQKRLITRLILALLLFLVPTVVEVLLQLFGITGDVTGGIR